MALILWSTVFVFFFNTIQLSHGQKVRNSTAPDLEQCTIKPTDEMSDFFRDIVTMQKEGIKLVEIIINFEEYSEDTDPLNEEGNLNSYEMHYFGRANTPQGMRLLDLSFHYDITELAKWSMGIKRIYLDVLDRPAQCTLQQSEGYKLVMLIKLLAPKGGDSKFYRLCHKSVREDNKDSPVYAVYENTCCWFEEGSLSPRCDIEPRNKWLVLLSQILFWVRILVLLFGPFLVSDSLQNQEFYKFNYYVKPKKIKKIYLCPKKLIKADEGPKSVLKLPEKKHKFKAFKSSVAKISEEKRLVQISRYKIAVNHRLLLTETYVPVSLWTRFYDGIASSRYGMDEESLSKVRWYFKLIGQILLVVIVGVPYYARVFAFYYVELPKIQSRWDIASGKDLLVPYEWNLISYLTPLHWVWIMLYINCYITITIVITSPEYCRCALAREIRRVAQNALAGLLYLNYFKGLATFGYFVIWPFKYFGCIALVFALVWFAFAIPFIVVILIIYLIPLSYLSARIIVGGAIWRKKELGSEEDMNITTEKTTFKEQLLLILDLFRIINISEDCSVYYEERYSRVRRGALGVVYNLIARIMVFFALLAVLLILSECVGFLVDLSVLILIGIIANAENFLKYVTIAVLIVFYVWDINRDIKDAYLKLTAAIFTILQGEIEELQSLMDLPSHLQQNTACIYDTGHSNQQSNLASDGKTLSINKLALYVDNNDTPRIPRELFELMANVEIVGTPGPIYKNYMRALVQLFCILVFLGFMFLIILSLGEEHDGSSGGSSLFATVVGGCLPLVIKVAFSPKAEELQLESLTFKAKLNEAVAELQQQWPLVDIEVDVCDEEQRGDEEVEATDKEQYETVVVESNEAKKAEA